MKNNNLIALVGVIIVAIIVAIAVVLLTGGNSSDEPTDDTNTNTETGSDTDSTDSESTPVYANAERHITALRASTLTQVAGWSYTKPAKQSASEKQQHHFISQDGVVLQFIENPNQSHNIKFDSVSLVAGVTDSIATLPSVLTSIEVMGAVYNINSANQDQMKESLRQNVATFQENTGGEPISETLTPTGLFANVYIGVPEDDPQDPIASVIVCRDTTSCGP